MSLINKIDMLAADGRTIDDAWILAREAHEDRGNSDTLLITRARLPFTVFLPIVGCFCSSSASRSLWTADSVGKHILLKVVISTLID